MFGPEEAGLRAMGLLREGITIICGRHLAP